MKFIKTLAYILVIIGALNWGLIGMFNYNLVAAMFGDMTVISRIIYSLVGISAILTAISLHRCENIRQFDSCEFGECKP